MGYYINIVKTQETDLYHDYAISSQPDIIEFIGRIAPEDKIIVMYAKKIEGNPLLVLDLKDVYQKEYPFNNAPENVVFRKSLWELIKALDKGEFPTSLSKQYG
jgi:hypothetical protein